MTLEMLPPRVRAHLYLFWVGMAASGLGVVGFFLSFWQVGSPAQAGIDVHDKIPVLAYASIFAWVVGLIIMRYSRRWLDTAVAKRRSESREAMMVDADVLNEVADAPVGREA